MGAEQDSLQLQELKLERAKLKLDRSGGTGTETYSHIWWALASAAQLGWAISSFRRGHAGDSHFMPFKAFSVASLFVGATATAAVSVLHVSGIHKKEDSKLQSAF
ncbi:uncharacterized protein LOC115984044 isoform X2 [Quercus lobata]|uniref:uncharacterized protein LOC115984044 isoform X2 n=1 Tax=Quercus lobata TaxID=97700 RepID=UPI0012446CE8|nr:uncharacterized protein LOC115984044 isoform X2 [Quercus lobata]